ncbi:MAG: hypothetical protein D6732_01265 [Methanobacteriota archaeon]|nr:MAG: hypothetical protein D6732_01265 [Euryarchaeota archaeon]
MTSPSSFRDGIIASVERYLSLHYPDSKDRMIDDFKEKLPVPLSEMESLKQIEELIMGFRPALSGILPQKEADTLTTDILPMFNAVLGGELRRREEKPKTPSIKIKFFCQVCNEEIHMPEDQRTLVAQGHLPIPLHHKKPVAIRTVRGTVERTPQKNYNKIASKRVLELLQFQPPLSEEGDVVTYLSVGIDVGSSTTHLIFSRLTLRQDIGFFNMTNRFNFVNRKVIYRSEIVNTPLLDTNMIDINGVVEFCKKEYLKAGIVPEMIETGAVIVTGESAKKRNAAEIVERLANETGKFVSATAGPNFESVLAALGSGIVDRSFERKNNILHVDIGGGTSNIALVSNGQVIGTACINIGGRLLGIRDDFTIWRIDEPAAFVMRELGMEYEIGDKIPEKDVLTISDTLADALIEVMRQPPRSPIAKRLMMTEPLALDLPIHEVSFSGGVGKLIYSTGGFYEDIGRYLAEAIKKRVKKLRGELVEPPNTIRATVIGAGAFSLSVSGSTTYFDNSLVFPVKNLPVVHVSIDRNNFTEGDVIQAIQTALNKYDLIEGEDDIALYFKDPVYPQYEMLQVFAKGIAKALQKSNQTRKLVVIISNMDMGSLLGLTIRKETELTTPLICLDELILKEGDWIDIGVPNGQTFPVTIKNLVFNK